MKQSLITLFLSLSLITFGQIPNTLTSADKVYGLSKFWQEVNYNFIYLNKIDREKWDNEYKKLITEVQNTENDYEYYRLLQKFCALLKDGHTNIYFPEKIYAEIYNTNFGDYRIFLTNIEGKAIITRINLSKKAEIPIGTEIIKVNGLNTSEYVNKYVQPYISSSTDYVLEDLSIQKMFESPIGTKFNVELKLPDNSIKKLTLIHSETKEKEVYPEFEDRALLDLKWLQNDILYIALNSFDDEKIDSLFIQKLPELYKAKALIIDLRYNGGGNTNIGLKILQYLTNDKVLYGAKNTSRLYIPVFKAWGTNFTSQDTLNNNPEWGMTKEEVTKCFLMAKDEYYYLFDYEADTVKLEAKKVVIPTVLLIGHNTASAAEDFLIYADNQKHMTKIGENSFGSTGQPYGFYLPGGGSARICTKKDTYPNGKEFVGYGIKPDIEIKPSLTDYLNKKDPVLEKAIEYLKKK